MILTRTQLDTPLKEEQVEELMKSAKISDQPHTIGKYNKLHLELFKLLPN